MKQNENGFTFIEIMIALTILIVGLLAVAQLQIAAIQGNGAANRLSQAMIVASDRLEKLIKLPYDNTDLDAGQHPPDGGTPIIVDDYYEVSWIITENVSENTKTIDVTVRWNEVGKPKERTLTYLVSG